MKKELYFLSYDFMKFLIFFRFLSIFNFIFMIFLCYFLIKIGKRGLFIVGPWS